MTVHAPRRKALFVLCALAAAVPLRASDDLAVAGFVRSSAGVPLAGATVTLDSGAATVTTETTGFYRLRMAAGAHVLRASHPGYEPATRAVSVTADLSDIDLRLQPAYRLSEQVVVQAVRAEARTPVTKTDIARAELEQAYHGQEMPVLLQRAPSMTQYSDTGLGAGYAYFYLRGIHQTRINVTLDGVPLNEPEDSTLYFVDFGDFASSVDSIQIQRGVGTSTVGAASYGGSINFASAQARNEREISGTVGTGSFGSHRASLGLHSGRFGPGLAVYGRGSYQETDGFRDHSGVVQRSVFYGVTRQGDRSFLKLFGFSGRESTQLAFLAVEKDLLERDLRTNPLSPAERDRFGQDFFHAQLSRALGVWSSLSVQGYYNGAGGWYRIWDGPARSALLQYELDWHFYGGLATFRHRRGRFELTAGAHANDFTSEHARRPAGTALRSYENHGHKNEANAFAKLGYDAGRWHLYGDAQVRRAKFRFEGDPDLGAVDWTFFNPKLGARYEPGPALGLYASVGKATREPARADLLSGEDNPTVLYDLGAVRPERVWDFEAGLDYRTPRLTLQANAYAMEFRNEIALTGELSEIGLPLRRNVDRSLRRGLELDAAWMVRPSLRLSATANLSRNRIRAWTQSYDVYDTDGAYLESVLRTYRDVRPLLTPALVANLGFAWTPVHGLEIAGVGRHVAKAHLDNTASEATTAPAFWNVDSSLSADLGRWLKAGRPRLRVQVNNVLDKRMFASGYSYLFLTRAPPGGEILTAIPYYYPLATRTVFVSLELRM